MNRSARTRQLIVSFVAVYPTITLLGWLLLPHLGNLPWPARTFALVLVMVPVVAFVTGPAAGRVVELLWPNTAGVVQPPQSLDRAP